MLLKNWIDPNKKIKFELLFWATRNGNSNENFYSHYDNKDSFFVVIKKKIKIIFLGDIPIIILIIKMDGNQLITPRIFFY